VRAGGVSNDGGPSDWSLITTSNGCSWAASPASVVASSTGRWRVGIRTSTSTAGRPEERTGAGLSAGAVTT
jgi:hypothetical protein